VHRSRMQYCGRRKDVMFCKCIDRLRGTMQPISGQGISRVGVVEMLGVDNSCCSNKRMWVEDDIHSRAEV
jgi:hypothetical protein